MITWPTEKYWWLRKCMVCGVEIEFSNNWAACKNRLTGHFEFDIDSIGWNYKTNTSKRFNFALHSGHFGWQWEEAQSFEDANSIIERALKLQAFQ